MEDKEFEKEYRNLMIFRCKTEKLIKAYKEILMECIMHSKINFCELPQIIRVSNYALYTTAFRVSYNDCHKSINMLKCVVEDYHIISNDTDNQKFISIFSSYYKIIDERFSGVNEYETFKKTVPEEILLVLQA